MNFLDTVDEIANSPLAKATIFAWDKYKRNKNKNVERGHPFGNKTR